MARPVRIHSDFRTDFAAQVNWLRRNADSSWLDRLDADLLRVVELVGSYAGAGSPAAHSGSIVLRRVLFPSTPYVAWYIYDEAARRGDVWMVRLFHSRQHRPPPDPSRWLTILEER